MTYKLNTNFFHSINTEAQAYCLGFFYARASGHIQLNKNNIQILHIISDLLQYNGPIHTYGNICEININQSGFTKTLLSLGCTLNCKYVSSLPNIPKHVLHHFVRAIYEDYGRAYLVKDKYLNINITFNEQFINELRIFLKKELNIDSKHYYRYTHTNTLQIMLTATPSVIKFLDYIYQPSFYYLERKFKIYRELKEKGV